MIIEEDNVGRNQAAMADGEEAGVSEALAITSEASDREAERIIRDALMRDIATLAASAWFDPNWYLKSYPDVESGGVEPAEHYAIYGWREGRDPGPFFSTAWYLAANPDVVASDLNPLIHFLDYGRAEGRAPNDSGFDPTTRAARKAAKEVWPGSGSATDREIKDAALVRASPLFNSDWYRSQLGDNDATVADLALHYVQSGAAAKRDPGPRFSSSWYLERNPDVLAIGLNPLVHYLRYGRAEGREGTPENIVNSNTLDPDAAAAAARSAPALGQDRAATGEHTPTVVLRGRQLGSWDARQLETLPGIATLQAFAKMHGWVDEDVVSISGTDGIDLPVLDVLRWSIDRRFPAADVMLVDAWMISDVTLRLRWEAIQADPLSAHVLHFYQACGDELIACGESALRGDSPAFIDATLLNPYKPLLITAVDAAGLLGPVTMLPFPSLLRGGSHHAEVAAAGERSSRADDQVALAEAAVREWLGWAGGEPMASLSHVEVDLTRATGSERLFDPFVRDWLAELFGISVVGDGDAADTAMTEHLHEALAWPASVPASRRRGGGLNVLRLPPDSLPTIAALASRRLARAEDVAMPVSFLVSETATARPRLHVEVPPLAILPSSQPPHLDSMPSLVGTGVAPGDPGDARPSLPLAIRFKKGLTAPPLIYLPTAPDGQEGLPNVAARGTVTAIVSGDADIALVRPLIASLAEQSITEAIDVVLIVDMDDEDAARRESLGDELLPGRVQIESRRQRSPAACINAAVARARGDHLLFLDGAMLLHDRRCVATLQGLLDDRQVFSAGCPQISSGSKGGDLSIAAGAFFPAGIAMTRAPHLLFEEPAAPSFPLEGTFAVVANSMRAMMVGTERFRACGALDERCFPTVGYDLELGLRAVREGLVNLNTTAVTVSDSAQRRGAWSQDLLAFHYLPPQRWQDLIGAVTVVRELH